MRNRPVPRVFRGIEPVAVAAGVALLLASGGALLTGCGKSDKSYEITDVRERRDAGPAAPPRTAAERFAPPGGGDDEPNPHAGGPRFEWTTPAGWVEAGRSQFREMGWTVSGGADTECSFATAGGGLLANVNRWRGQMALAATDAAGVAALEKRPFFGREATLVELSGTFKKGGMGGAATTIEDAKLLGLIVELPATAAFLKLTGPAAVVDAEKPHFLALAASISMAKGGPAPAAPERPAPDEPAEKAPFSWTAPPGWSKQGAKTMRLVTLVPEKAPRSEAYVSILSGAAGGARANLDRWRGQMGGKPLSDAEFDALPRAKVLGGTAIFLAAEGAWGGMGGGEAKAGWMLLGMVLEGGDRTVFVKMTGPADEVRGEQERFRAFCESFHE